MSTDDAAEAAAAAAAAATAPAPPGLRARPRAREALVESEARADQLVLKLADCFAKDRASGVVCGLSSNEAPFPWSALNGAKCRGYDTLSTREGDYCGYWESDVNPLAADSTLRKELLSVGPFCFDDQDGALLLAARRTQRGGVTDVDYMKRPDRSTEPVSTLREAGGTSSCAAPT